MKGIDIDMEEVLRGMTPMSKVPSEVDKKLSDFYCKKVWIEGEFELPGELKDKGIELTPVAYTTTDGIWDLTVYRGSDGKYYIGDDDEEEGVLVEIKQRDEEDEIEDEYEVYKYCV